MNPLFDVIVAALPKHDDKKITEVFECIKRICTYAPSRHIDEKDFRDIDEFKLMKARQLVAALRKEGYQYYQDICDSLKLPAGVVPNENKESEDTMENKHENDGRALKNAGEVKPTSHPGSLDPSSEDLTSTFTDGGNRVVRKTSTNNGNIRSTNTEGSHVRTRSVGKVEYVAGEVKPTSHPGSLDPSSEDLTSTFTDGGNRVVRKTSTNNGNIRSTNTEGSHVRTRSVGKVEYVAALEKTSTNLQDRFDRGIQSLQDAMETHFARLANMIKTLDDRVERVENIISDSQDDSSNKFTAMQNMVSEVKHAQSMIGAGLQPPQEDSPATKTTKTQTDDEDVGAKRMATQTDDIEIRDITGYKSMGLQTEAHLLEPLNGHGEHLQPERRHAVRSPPRHPTSDSESQYEEQFSDAMVSKERE